MATLSPLQLSMIHHIELNKSGWWDSVVKREILGVIWLAGNQCKLRDIQSMVYTTFASTWDSKYDFALRSLVSSGEVISHKSDYYDLSEIGRKQIESIVVEAEDICANAQSIFVEIADRTLPGVDSTELWESFNELFLKPSIKNYGGLAVGVFGKGLNDTSKIMISSFYESHPDLEEQILEQIIVAFLTSTDVRVSKYIIGLSNSVLCVFASGLDNKTLEMVYEETPNQDKEFFCYLDTNFLFSILGLHENPSNSAANALLNLSKILSPILNVRYFVSQDTLLEFKQAFGKQIEELEEIRFSKGIAFVSSKNFTGMGKSYAEYYLSTDEPQSPKDYFKPIIENMVLFLRNKGIEVLTDDTSYLRLRQDVIDDILRQQKYEDQQCLERKKSYKQIEHDIVLWHLVKEKRSANIENPLSAKYWIITLDYRLIGFDDFKKSDPDYLPCCILPTTLFQLLQFWVPRSDELEKTLLNSLWLPFFMISPKADSEHVTRRIINMVSRLEGIEEAPAELINGILLNRALRQKMELPKSDTEQISLIREALIAQNITISEQKQRAEQEVDQLQTKLSEFERKATDIIRESQETQDLLELERKTNKDLVERIRIEEERRISLEIAENERIHKEALLKIIRRFWIKCGVWLIITIGINVFLPLFFPTGYQVWLIIGNFIALVVLRLIFCRPVDALTSYEPYKACKNVVSWIITVPLVGIIIDVVSELIKGYIFNIGK